MPAVAFQTVEGPKVSLERAEGYCYNFLWRLKFFATNGSGLNPGVRRNGGFVVQRVSINKVVTDCDDNPIPAESFSGGGFEYFEIGADGFTAVDVNADAFLNERKTKVSVELQAGYVRRIRGAAMDPTPNNPLGSDGRLDQEPRGFRVTLTRRIELEVICCPTGQSVAFEFSAANSFDTYSEKWSGRAEGEQEIETEHVKIVDGQRVE